MFFKSFFSSLLKVFYNVILHGVLLTNKSAKIMFFKSFFSSLLKVFYSVILHGVSTYYNIYIYAWIGYDIVRFNYPKFLVKSHSFPLFSFPKYPSLTSHGNLPESLQEISPTFATLISKETQVKEPAVVVMVSCLHRRYNVDIGYRTQFHLSERPTPYVLAFPAPYIFRA